MTTALNTSRRQHWNGLDNYWMYWTWWMIPIKQTMKVTVKATPTTKATPGGIPGMHRIDFISYTG